MKGRELWHDEHVHHVSPRDIMAVVSGGRRLDVVVGLAYGEQSFAALVKYLEITNSHVSKSLAILADYGLVRTRQIGRSHYYRISDRIRAQLRQDVLASTYFNSDGPAVIVLLHGANRSTEMSAVLEQVRADAFHSRKLASP